MLKGIFFAVLIIAAGIGVYYFFSESSMATVGEAMIFATTTTCPDPPPHECRYMRWGEVCLAYYNKISCGTCVTSPYGSGCTYENRKDDASYGVDCDGDAILDEGDKDDVANDGYIDCYYFTSAVREPRQPSNYADNSLWSICRDGVCVNAPCRCDCNAKGGATDSDLKWLKHKGQTPSSQVVAHGGICPSGSTYAGYVCVKRSGTWSELDSRDPGYHNSYRCYLTDDTATYCSRMCTDPYRDPGCSRDYEEKGSNYKCKQCETDCKNRYGKGAYFYVDWDLAGRSYCYCARERGTRTSYDTNGDSYVDVAGIFNNLELEQPFFVDSSLGKWVSSAAI